MEIEKLTEMFCENEAVPVKLILHCPECGLQHIDARGASTRWANNDHPPATTTWTSPPHRSHLCHDCGHIWRPADIPTEGVAAIKTRGKADSPQGASDGAGGK